MTLSVLAQAATRSVDVAIHVPADSGARAEARRLARHLASAAVGLPEVHAAAVWLDDVLGGSDSLGDPDVEAELRGAQAALGSALAGIRR